jgi:hypothetical protein
MSAQKVDQSTSDIVNKVDMVDNPEYKLASGKVAPTR